MAVVDYFLKIDGIDGEAQDTKHKNEIQLESWSFGATNGGTAALGLGMGQGKVQMGDFHFVMRSNKASPKLYLACCDGEHIKKAILTCRKAGKDQQEYLVWTFTDLVVSSFQTGGAASSDVVPLDQISINFTQGQIDYKEQKADGTLGGAVTTKYNVKTQSSA
jgi:type VI secretion system secreted protein Hcp